MSERSGSGSNAVVPPSNVVISPNRLPPLNLLLILKEESGEDLFSLSMKDLRDKLLNGLILRDKEFTEKQFYWMDRQSERSCFMLLPKSLKISADSGQFPRFVYETENQVIWPDITLPRVKYEGVKRLYLGGKFGTMGLSSGMVSEYEVVLYLQVMSTRGPRSAHSYLATRLYLPNGTQIQNPWYYVGQIPTQTWHSFPVGKFEMNPDNIGELSFDLAVAFWSWRDVLIKGVAIKSLPTK